MPAMTPPDTIFLTVIQEVRVASTSFSNIGDLYPAFSKVNTPIPVITRMMIAGLININHLRVSGEILCKISGGRLSKGRVDKVRENTAISPNTERYNQRRNRCALFK